MNGRSANIITQLCDILFLVYFALLCHTFANFSVLWFTLVYLCKHWYTLWYIGKLFYTLHTFVILTYYVILWLTLQTFVYCMQWEAMLRAKMMHAVILIPRGRWDEWMREEENGRRRKREEKGGLVNKRDEERETMRQCKA